MFLQTFILYSLSLPLCNISYNDKYNDKYNDTYLDNNCKYFEIIYLYDNNYNHNHNMLNNYYNSSIKYYLDSILFNKNNTIINNDEYNDNSYIITDYLFMILDYIKYFFYYIYNLFIVDKNSIILDERILNNSDIYLDYLLYFFYDIFLVFLFLSGLFILGFSISLLLFGHLFYVNMKNNNKYIEDTGKDNDDFYEYNYIEEYDNLLNEDINDEKYEKIKNVFVREITPRGVVYMGYNKELSSFVYYSNNSSLNYQYLDCVARKFIIENNCKKLYYHLYDEILSSYSKIDSNNISDDNDSDNDNDNDNVFLSVKDYNNKKKSNDVKFDKKCNKFKYLGTLNEYELIYENKSQSNNIKNISFKDYKKNLKSD